MAAAEISTTKIDPLPRFPLSILRGDADPRDGRARGFDSIVDLPNFAGGLFSFWNRESIRLLGSGILLTTPGSLIPSCAPAKKKAKPISSPRDFLGQRGSRFRHHSQSEGLREF